MKAADLGLVYHVYPLGALGAPHRNEGNLTPQPRLKELEEWIPHWKALGTGTILFGPLFDSESHGYDTRDPRRVDPRLGTEEDLIRLIRRLKGQGFRILFDGVFNHTGRSFSAFRQIQESGGHTDRARWYKDVRAGQPSPWGTSFSYRGWNGHGSLPELNLADPEVRRYLLETAGFWMDTYGIDGLRLDAADVLDFSFMEELSRYCKARNPDFWLLGEVIHGDYSRWIREAGLDSVTNYELYKSLWSSLKDCNFYELAWTLGRQFSLGGLCRDFAPLTFLENHDVSRLSSLLPDRKLRNVAWELSFFLPGIPSLYYGGEWDWSAVKGSGEDWNLRPPCRPGDLYTRESRVMDLSALAELRRTWPLLADGGLQILGNTHRQLAFLRTAGENNSTPSGEKESLLVLVNASEEWTDWSAGFNGTTGDQIWGTPCSQPGNGRFRLPPHSVMAYRTGR